MSRDAGAAQNSALQGQKTKRKKMAKANQATHPYIKPFKIGGVNLLLARGKHDKS